MSIVTTLILICTIITSASRTQETCPPPPSCWAHAPSIPTKYATSLISQLWLGYHHMNNLPVTQPRLWTMLSHLSTIKTWKLTVSIESSCWRLAYRMEGAVSRTTSAWVRAVTGIMGYAWVNLSMHHVSATMNVMRPMPAYNQLFGHSIAHASPWRESMNNVTTTMNANPRLPVEHSLGRIYLSV